jgi:hypothetical protein
MPLRAGPVGFAFDETPDFRHGLLILYFGNHLPDPNALPAHIQSSVEV